MTSAPLYVAGGGLRIDYIVTRDGRAHLGLAGGNALYAAVGAALWSDRVAPWARVGEKYPFATLSQLEHKGLDLSGLRRIAGDHDHRTFYAYTPDGRRDDTNPVDHFARIGVDLPVTLDGYVHSTPGQANLTQFEPLSLRFDDWPPSFDDARAVHLAPSPIHSHKNLVERIGERGKRIVTLDPGERYMVPELISIVRELMPYVDAFLPSESEIRSLLGYRIELRAAAEKLADWGAPIVVVKRGRNGVLVFERESGRVWQQPAYHPWGDQRVKDVTGAGDAFCGGFMVGLARSGEPEIAARLGVVSASVVVEGYGALYAMRQRRNLVESRLQRLARRKDKP